MREPSKMGEASAPPHIRLEMLSQPRFLAAARSMVSNVAQRLGFNEIQCGQISLAVDEALCNVINHGYGRRGDGLIWVHVWAIEPNPVGIRIMIEDRARQVDPSSIRSRDLDDVRPGGLGVHLIRETMDEVRFERREGGVGMRVTMTKMLPGAEAASSPPTSSTKEPEHE